MSLRTELRVVPRTAKIISLVAYFGFVILIHFLIPLNKEPGDIWTWPLAGQLAFNFLIPLIPVPLILFYGYIYGDAKRRGMRYGVWTLLAIFVPYLIGVILYFILRDPLPAECPGCHTVVVSKFAFCPHCGASLKPSCPQCGRSIEPGWVNCGYCGTRMPLQQQQHP